MKFEAAVVEVALKSTASKILVTVIVIVIVIPKRNSKDGIWYIVCSRSRLEIATQGNPYPETTET